MPTQDLESARAEPLGVLEPLGALTPVALPPQGLERAPGDVCGFASARCFPGSMRLIGDSTVVMPIVTPRGVLEECDEGTPARAGRPPTQTLVRREDWSGSASAGSPPLIRKGPSPVLAE